MKKCAIILLLAWCAVCLAGCYAPFVNVEISDRRTEKLYVYVCGAVLNEGVYTVEEGTDIFGAIFLAQMHPQGVLPANCSAPVTSETQVVVVNFALEGKTCYAINVNGAVVTCRLPSEALPPSIVDKLADYYHAYGKIRNKQTLKQILQQDYDAYAFRLYVAKEDYEKAS